MEPRQNKQISNPKISSNSKDKTHESMTELLQSWNGLNIAYPLSNVDLLQQPRLNNHSEEPEMKCSYCNGLFSKAQFQNHQNACESMKVQCDACGEKVLLDILDYHLSFCTGPSLTYQTYHYNNNNNNLARQLSVDDEEEVPGNEFDLAGGEEENHEDWEDEDDVDYPEEELDEYEIPGYQFGGMTYEQLMALDNNIVKKGMNENEMKQFPVELYSKSPSDTATSCHVCLSDFETGESTRKLTCGHKFHKDCIDIWLKNNITCPVCKKFLR